MIKEARATFFAQLYPLSSRMKNICAFLSAVVELAWLLA